MTKASEDVLNALHAAVAASFIKHVTAPLLVDGEPVPGSEGLGCTAATLSAMITFLKNNNIQADPAENEGLRDLAATLAKRRQEGRESLRAESLAAASAAFESAQMSADRLQ